MREPRVAHALATQQLDAAACRGERRAELVGEEGEVLVRLPLQHGIVLANIRGDRGCDAREQAAPERDQLLPWRRVSLLVGHLEDCPAQKGVFADDFVRGEPDL